MDGLDRQQVLDIVGLSISELKIELTSVLRQEFESNRIVERSYHAERTSSVIHEITGCKIGEYDQLREDLGFLNRFRRGYRKVTLIVAGSFIGLWAKSFWQEILAFFPSSS